MAHPIKVYHYTYWYEFNDRNFLNELRFYDEEILGMIYSEDNEVPEITLINQSESCIYLDDNCTATRVEWGENKETLCIEYFTIDEKNGYDKFLKYVIDMLSRLLQDKNKGKEKK